MAINVPHPLGHKWVGAIPQEEMNLRITLGKGSLRPTFKMVEFKAMQPMEEHQLSPMAQGLSSLLY